MGEWDTDGEVHKLPIMAKLREELHMQMRSIHSRYDCVRKVMIRNPDLQKASAQTGTRGSAEALVRLDVLRPEQESSPEDNL